MTCYTSKNKHSNTNVCFRNWFLLISRFTSYKHLWGENNFITIICEMYINIQMKNDRTSASVMSSWKTWKKERAESNNRVFFLLFALKSYSISFHPIVLSSIPAATVSPDNNKGDQSYSCNSRQRGNPQDIRGTCNEGKYIL